MRIPTVNRLHFLTYFLIAASCVLTLVTTLDRSGHVLELLLISPSEAQGFQSIVQGQVWRLLTPIFVHFGVLHLLFNLQWLWILGSVLEASNGRMFLTVFVLFVGIMSNVAEFVITRSVLFGGMSGVVYGLIGYVWVHGKYARRPKFGITNSMLMWTLGWYALCWTGVFGPIANWAHTFGLLIGLAIGFVDTFVMQGQSDPELR